MTLHPSWAPFGSPEAMLQFLQRPAPGSLDSSTREKGCVCVSVCKGLGEGGLWGNESATQFSNPPPHLQSLLQQDPKVNSHPFSHFSVSFCHFMLPPPPLSSEVNKELFQSDMRNRGGCSLCMYVYVCVRNRVQVAFVTSEHYLTSCPPNQT